MQAGTAAFPSEPQPGPNMPGAGSVATAQILKLFSMRHLSEVWNLVG